MKKSLRKIALSSALIAGLALPSLAVAAEVPQVPNSAVDNGNSAAVSTEQMKVVKVKAAKKTSPKKATVKKASVKKAKKKAVKKVAKKRVRRSIIRK